MLEKALLEACLVVTCIFSGQAGSPGQASQADAPVSDGFAFSAACRNDVDLDGVPDIIVGDPAINGPEHRRGGVWTISGRSGKALEHLLAEEGEAWFGSAVAYLDNKHTPREGRLVVGCCCSFPAHAIRESENKTDAGCVYLLSSAGKTIKRLRGASPGERLGVFVSTTIDYDGDAIDDFLVCSAGRPVPDQLPGRVLVCSGADGKVLLELAGQDGQDGFAAALIVRPQPSVHEHPLLLVATGYSRAEGAAMVRAYDATTGLPRLYTIRGESEERSFGKVLMSLGDLDRDGWPEIAIAVPGGANQRPAGEPGKAGDGGHVLIVNGKDGTLVHRIDAPVNVPHFGSSLTRRQNADGSLRDLLIASSRRSGSSLESWLCSYTGPNWEQKQAVSLGLGGGQWLFELDAKAASSRLVTGLCDCDTDGQPGTLDILSPGSLEMLLETRRAACLADIGQQKK
jgi:hypothetical protein